MLRPLLKVQMLFPVAGARDSAPCQKWAKREGIVAFPKKQWQAWGIWRDRSAKLHFAWQVQEVRALISWEALHFGASDLQVCYDDFAWQVQHSVWPGSTFAWQAQHFTQMEWKIAKHIGTRPSFLRIAVLLMLSSSKIEEFSQNSFVFKLADI